MIDQIARPEVPALRASNLFKAGVTTLSRAWLLNAGPSGLHRYFQQPTILVQSFLKFVEHRASDASLCRRTPS
jgi:hypothetical protein